MLCWRPSVERLCRWGGGEAKSRRSATLPPQAPGHSGGIQRRLDFFVRTGFDLVLLNSTTLYRIGIGRCEIRSIHLVPLR